MQEVKGAIMFRKLISIALSCAIAVTTLSVVASAKSAKIEDVPIATESIEINNFKIEEKNES